MPSKLGNPCASRKTELSACIVEAHAYGDSVAYFDYNATAPLLPEARNAWLQAQETLWQNPSSAYRSAVRVSNALDAARQRMAELFDCSPKRIVFTSGTTEANNAVLAYYATHGESIAVSAVEHSSMLAPAKQFHAQTLPVDSQGGLDLTSLEDCPAGLISVMAANNETGVLQPWEAVLHVCLERKKSFFCDAAQWVGKLPLDGLSRCHWLSAGAHKFGGPKGCGFLLVPEAEASDFHCFLGGGQEHGRRAGTEDYPAIAAMLAALESVLAQRGDSRARDAFEKRLSEVLPEFSVHGQGAPRLWNTSSVELPRFVQQRWLAHLDKAGFEVSAGSACGTAKNDASPVLAAMGVSKYRINHTLRMSASQATTEADWLALADAIGDIWNHLNEEMKSSAVIEL